MGWILARRPWLPQDLQKELFDLSGEHNNVRRMVLTQIGAPMEEKVQWSVASPPAYRKEMEFCFSLLVTSKFVNESDMEWLIHGRLFTGKKSLSLIKKAIKAQPHWVKLALSKNPGMPPEFSYLFHDRGLL